MQTNVHLPQLELTMENIRVAAVRVSLGDSVTAGQSLVEIETEKAVVDVPSPRDGCVRAILVKAGEQIGAKALLCVLTDKTDEPLEDQASASAHEPAPLTPSLSPSAEERVSARTGEGVRRSSQGQLDPFSLLSAARSEVPEGPIKAAPAARKLAKDLRLELATITGTGPEGRITVKDVQEAADALASRATTTDWTPLSASRLALIAQMQKSLAEIPQFHVARRLDVAPLLVKAERITFTVRLVRAAAVALAKHPPLRTMIAGNNIRVAPANVAIAIETPRGLIAPAVRGAGFLSLEQIAGMIKVLRERARAGTLRRDELIDAPFAISNLGMFGVDFFNAFVFHGQTVVLAIGRAVDGQAWFSLAADHRIVDGAEAARFLETLQQEILQA